MGLRGTAAARRDAGRPRDDVRVRRVHRGAGVHARRRRAAAPVRRRALPALLSDAVRAYSHLRDVLAEPLRPDDLRGLVVSNSWGMFHPSWDLPKGDAGNYSDNLEPPVQPRGRRARGARRGHRVRGRQLRSRSARTRAARASRRTRSTARTAIRRCSASRGVDTQSERVGYSAIGPGRLADRKPDICGYTHFKGSEVFDSDGGTSAACPVVAGAVAAVRSKRAVDPADPATSPAAIRELLASTARDLGAAGYDYEHGYGIVDGAKLRDEVCEEPAQPSGEPPPEPEQPSGEPSPPEPEQPSGEPPQPEPEQPSGEPSPPEPSSPPASRRSPSRAAWARCCSSTIPAAFRSSTRCAPCSASRSTTVDADFGVVATDPRRRPVRHPGRGSRAGAGPRGARAAPAASRRGPVRRSARRARWSSSRPCGCVQQCWRSSVNRSWCRSSSSRSPRRARCWCASSPAASATRTCTPPRASTRRATRRRCSATRVRASSRRSARACATSRSATTS